MATNKGEYSFSTCWNIKEHTVGREMIEEIRSLGFQRVELNYNVTTDLMKTIEPMIHRGEMGVSSVHNVFPFVPDKRFDTDSVMLGFEEKELRERAVELLLGSMEQAYRFGAKAVVVHPGEVPFETNIDEELKRIYKTEGRESEAYQKVWEHMLAKREADSPAYLARIRDSLEEACGYAARKGWDVAIGIETRSRCYQIPTLKEASDMIDSLQGAPVYLWYDIGHGTMMGRMGLYDNVKEVREMKHKIVGVHIHETIELSDHWCPYVNSKDSSGFDVFLDIIDAAPIKVYEIKAACTAEDIEESHGIITSKIAALTGSESGSAL
ncbi:sugar phosphate isomerase/epimerase family protein [Paenibacillus rigui]|uniref:Xylose isomerase n=1 Tax=Paenibacillus rigui TaxID=554312 RepID=A0A229UYI5_9BACL|nr:TIM barrel protein [Paenibacillus rigui]OXM88291.1 xylose isomerase [Paenibacillus rigui]